VAEQTEEYAVLDSTSLPGLGRRSFEVPRYNYVSTYRSIDRSTIHPSNLSNLHNLVVQRLNHYTTLGILRVGKIILGVPAGKEVWVTLVWGDNLRL
jgi:hypothetical protein